MNEEERNFAKELEEEMPNWDYRVFAEPCPVDEWSFTIRSVYYDEDGNPESFSKTVSQPEGFAMAVLAEDLRMMQDALAKPVFDLEKFPNIFKL